MRLGTDSAGGGDKGLTIEPTFAELPASVDAERAILGHILLDDSLFSQTELLRPDDFCLDAHRRIYRRIAELAKASKPVDTITLIAELSRRGELQAIGGTAYITSLYDGLPRRANIGHYVKMVREAAGKRFAAHAGEAITAHAMNGCTVGDLAVRFTDFARQLAEYDSGSATRITELDQIPDPFSINSTGTEWLVDGLIPCRELIVIASEPGVGKTFLALALARAVTFGAEFLGRKSQKAQILYLDRENPIGVILDRLQVLTGGPGVLRPWGMWCPDEPPLIGDPRLLEFAKLEPVIIFDSFIRFHGADENDASEMAVVNSRLRALQAAGATLIVLHHRGKSETSNYRGSSDIAGGCDLAYALGRRDDLLELRTFKTRHVDVGITIRPDFAAGKFEVVDSPAVVQKRDDVARLSGTMRAKPGISTNELIDDVKIGRTAVYRLLRDNESIWRYEVGPNNTKRWFLRSGCTEYQAVLSTGGTTEAGCTGVPTPLGVVHSTPAVPSPHPHASQSHLTGNSVCAAGDAR